MTDEVTHSTSAKALGGLHGTGGLSLRLLALIIFASNEMHFMNKVIFAIAISASQLLFSGPASAQAGSYGKVVQRCTLAISGRAIPFKCRWMYDGISGGTIFVDNYDTDERYIVENSGWSTVGLIGDGKKACIKSPRGAVACLIK